MKSFLAILLLSFYTLPLYSQNNIINTLGTGGIYTIKDSSTNYFTLRQSTGQVNILKTLGLENTTSATTGIIFKGTDRFLHNYGNNNLFLGINSGNFNMTGDQNTAVGLNTLNSNSTGTQNTSIGYQSLRFNTSGSDNASLGFNSLYTNTIGNHNTALGSYSLFSNSTGSYNTAVGWQSLFYNSTGEDNTAVGLTSLYSNTTGYQNTVVGRNSLSANTTGYRNTALGSYCLLTNTTGYYNTALGSGSLYLNTGNSNTSVGLNSLYNNNTGCSNTAIGFQTLGYNTTGSYNTAIGQDAGTIITTGSNNTAIGLDAQVPDGTASNQVRIGNTGITYAGIQIAWTITSDRKWKQNIMPLNVGLNFISKLNPVTYTRINDESQKTEYGFIAQELEGVLRESGVENNGMVSITNKGMYELRYNDLFAPIVKAIQELKSENDILKTENRELKERLFKIEQMQNKIAIEIEIIKTKNDNLMQVQTTK